MYIYNTGLKNTCILWHLGCLMDNNAPRTANFVVTRNMQIAEFTAKIA